MSPSQPIGSAGAFPCCLRWGGLAGVLSGAALVSWVLAANRIPSLERFAQDRNLAGLLAIAVFFAMLFFRFLNSPARIFVSGMISWTVLTGSYVALETAFPRLEQRLGAFHLFLLGAVAFGLLAAATWVARMLISVRQQPLAASSRRLP